MLSTVSLKGEIFFLLFICYLCISIVNFGVLNSAPPGSLNCSSRIFCVLVCLVVRD